MESPIVVTKVRLNEMTRLDTTYAGAKFNKPIVDVSRLKYHDVHFRDDPLTTAYIIDIKDIDRLKLPDIRNIDTSLADSEVLIFRNVEPNDSPVLTTYVAIDLPTRRKYMRRDARYAALKTYCAFLTCRKMGITKIVTTRLGGDVGASDFLQLLSAWLAGIELISFRRSRISREIEAFHYPDVWYPDDYILEFPIYKGAYPEYTAFSWRTDERIHKGDLIKFDDRLHGWVYGSVTQDVEPGNTIVFFKLDTIRTMLWRSDLDEPENKYVAVAPDTIPVDPLKGILRPSRTGNYMYNRREVIVYVVPEWDISVEESIPEK